MDYLLDSYVYAYLPFGVSDEWKRSISGYGMSAVRAGDWMCKTQDMWSFYENHTSFLAAELVYPLLAMITFIHAYRKGTRYVYTWLGTAVFAIAAAVCCELVGNMNSSWNAQGVLTFFGGRFPLSALFGVHQFFLYTSYILVQRMHLAPSAQGIATGLLVLALKFPYFVLGTKLLWWTWQGGVPAVSERVYGVPWTALFLEATSACSFVWALRLVRSALLVDLFDWKKFVREFFCCLVAGIAAFWLAVAEQTMLSRFMDRLGLPSGLVICAILVLSAQFVYIADRRNPNPEAHTRNRFWFDELAFGVCVHLIFLICLLSSANPVNVVSVGMHQPVVGGNCSAITGSLPRLCASELADPNFDFHCVPGGKLAEHEDGLEWYAICGTPFDNWAEYAVLTLSSCLFALLAVHQAAAASGKTPKVYRVVYRTPERKKHN